MRANLLLPHRSRAALSSDYFWCAPLSPYLALCFRITRLAKIPPQNTSFKGLRYKNTSNKGVSARRLDVRPTVTASTRIARFYRGRKDGCHRVGVEKVRAVSASAASTCVRSVGDGGLGDGQQLVANSCVGLSIAVEGCRHGSLLPESVRLLLRRFRWRLRG
jgi:hypothetical protein